MTQKQSNETDWSDSPFPYYRGAIINAYFDLMQSGEVSPVVACYDLTKDASLEMATKLTGKRFDDVSAPMLTVGIPSVHVQSALGHIPGFHCVAEFHRDGMAAVVMIVGQQAHWISMPIPNRRYNPADN